MNVAPGVAISELLDRLGRVPAFVVFALHDLQLDQSIGHRTMVVENGVAEFEHERNESSPKREGASSKVRSSNSTPWAFGLAR